MNIPTFLDLKNSESVAKWRWRWHLQGGSKFWIARDLIDLRSEGYLELWRETDHKLRNTPYSKRKLANLARWRTERDRRRPPACRTAFGGIV